MHKLIERKTSGSLNHGSIGPKSRIQHDMPIRLDLCDGSLENGLKWFIQCFNLSIHLRVIRRGVLLLIPLLWSQLFHHFILKVPTMVSDNLFRNAEPSNNLVENEMHGYLTIGFNRGHSFCPFCEIINGHYNVMMPPQPKLGCNPWSQAPTWWRDRWW